MRLPLVLVLILFGTTAMAADWKTYKLGKGFSIDLPGKPESVSPTEWTVTSGGAFYMVLEDPKIDETPDHAQLGEFVTELMSGEGCKMVSVQDVLFKGWRGLDYKFDADGLQTWGKVYIVKSSLYLVQVSYPIKTGSPANTLKYFDSFVPAFAESGPYKAAGPEFKPYTSAEFGYIVPHVGDPTIEKRPTTAEQPDLSGVLARSVYGNRIYFSAALLGPEEIPSTATDEEIQSVAEGFLTSFGQSFDLGKTKPTWKRTPDGIEVSAIAKAPKNFGARVEVTISGRVLFLRMFYGPEIMVNTKATRDWFAGFKKPGG